MITHYINLSCISAGWLYFQSVIKFARSPGVIAAIVAYVERAMKMFGLELTHRKVNMCRPFYNSEFKVSCNNFRDLIQTLHRM